MSNYKCINTIEIQLIAILNYPDDEFNPIIIIKKFYKNILPSRLKNVVLTII